MLHVIEKLYERDSITVSSVSLGLIYLRAPVTGKIKRFALWFSGGGVTSSWKFDIRVAGVSQFPDPVDMLTLNIGNNWFDEIGGLSIDVTEGDILLLDARSGVGGPLVKPATLLVEIDDEVDYVTGATRSTDGTFAANSDTLVPSQKAVKTYVTSAVAGGGGAATLDDLTDVAITAAADGDFLQRVGGLFVNRTTAQILTALGLADAQTIKGGTDCSPNPNYPAADAGDLYRVTVAGKIGGASGIVVEVGDAFLCFVDGTAGGTQAGVGANWIVIQTNIDGAATGAASSTDNDIALFDGVTGKVIKDSGKTHSTDGTFAANSDALIPTQKAVKSYVSSLGGVAALDDLTDVTITSPTNDDILQRKAGVFVNRTPTQYAADLAELIPIVNLSDVTFTGVANDDFLQRKAGLWVNRTPAQVAADLGVTDAFIFKGVIDCSANPNYPAADAGHVYKISVAGKIGGASGPNVEIGDSITCIADSTASGNHATVGSFWYISQVNIDGAVVGPTSATDAHIALFDGGTGKLIKDSAKVFSTDGTLAGNSDSNVSTEKAVKAYVDTSIAGIGAGSGFDGFLVKSSSTTRTSTTTYADDPTLTFTVLAGQVYAIEIMMWITCNAGSVGGKFRHNYTQTSQQIRVGYEYIGTFVSLPNGFSPTTSLYSSIDTGTDRNIGNSGFFAQMRIVAVIKGHATNNGTFSIQWAQSASDVNGLSVELGSWLRYKKA